MLARVGRIPFGGPLWVGALVFNRTLPLVAALSLKAAAVAYAFASAHALLAVSWNEGMVYALIAAIIFAITKLSDLLVTTWARFREIADKSVGGQLSVCREELARISAEKTALYGNFVRANQLVSSLQDQVGNLLAQNGQLISQIQATCLGTTQRLERIESKVTPAPVEVKIDPESTPVSVREADD
jgi:hypothetical protein